MKIIFKTTDGVINVAEMKVMSEKEIFVDKLDMKNVGADLKVPNLKMPGYYYDGEVIINKQQVIWYVLQK